MPSPCGTARVRTAARSEPACGSVRFIVPVHVAGDHLRQVTSASARREPRSSIASIAPCVSSGHRSNARFDACHISSTAVATSCGRPWPPNSGLLVSPFQPFSQNCRYASLNPAGVFTVPSSRRRAPSRSPDHVERVEHVGRELRRLLEDRRDGVGRRLLETRQRARPARGRRARSARTACRRAARDSGSWRSKAKDESERNRKRTRMRTGDDRAS